jgi:hypothetical protein
VLEFFADHQFLSALAAIVGPLVVFAAPTEEIEHLLFADDLETAMVPEINEEAAPESLGFPEAA